MKKFNEMIQLIEEDDFGCSAVSDATPDTGKDVGECGQLDGKVSSGLILIKLMNGIEIQIPLEIAHEILSSAGVKSMNCDNEQCGAVNINFQDGSGIIVPMYVLELMSTAINQDQKTGE